MNLFDPADHDHLVGPPHLFDREHLQEKHDAWGHQLLRAATALEFLAQITRHTDDILVKGGTLLQNSLSWPPLRASVDLDLEVGDADRLRAVLARIEDQFEATEISLSFQESPLPGFTGHVRFPQQAGPDWTLRIDTLENDLWPTDTEPWASIPPPWQDAPRPQAPSLEIQTAQKLLLAASPPYGRDLDHHHGRQNFVKDLFDLRCLGHEPIDDTAV